MTTTEESVAPNRFHDEFGSPSGRAVTKLKGHLPPWVQDFVRNAPFAVMATTNSFCNCDASP